MTTFEKDSWGFLDGLANVSPTFGKEGPTPTLMGCLLTLRAYAWRDAQEWDTSLLGFMGRGVPVLIRLHLQTKLFQSLNATKSVMGTRSKTVEEKGR